MGLASIRQFLVLVLLLGIVVCSGCGSGNSFATITGTVKLDGTPVSTGSIEFRTLNGAGVVAFSTITNGSFSVTADANLLPGTYQVVIRSPQKSGKQIPAGSPAPPGTMVDEIVEAIPSQYNDTTSLERTVNLGANKLEFDLTGQVARGQSEQQKPNENP